MGDVQRTIDSDAASGQDYTLVIALSKPANVEQLMRTGIDLATDQDGQIHVVSVVHKHVTSPFLLFSEDRIKAEYADSQNAVLDTAVSLAADASVPVERRLLVGSDVSKALLSAVRDVDADALLIGWQKRSRASDVVLGTTVDRVVHRAPCDVFVERVGTTADGVNAVLLPTDGGPHIGPAVDLAAAVARSNDATVTVVSYVDSDAEEAERERADGHVTAAVKRVSDVPVAGEVREADDVADAIVSAASDHDLVALGATREGWLRNRTIGSVAAAVGQHATPPVVIVKRRSEESLLARTFGGWWR